MKKIIIALVAMITLSTTTASAMSYEQARQQALFLTDKMAYELNLTDDQYEAAYEVNLDYLMGVNTYDDLYGSYWRQRNTDLSYILLDWQYQAFLNATYFYRPLYWNSGYFHFGIYARYPRRDFFFFGRPHFYGVYCGGHSWRMNGGRSWYSGRTFGRPMPGGQPRMGMRDGFNRGDFGRGQVFGNSNRPSSTRTTVNRDRSFGNGPRPNGNAFGNTPRPNGNSFGGSSRPNGNAFGNTARPNNNNSFGGMSKPNNSSSFGGSTSRPGGSSFGNSSRPSGSSFGNMSRPSGSSFGNMSRPSGNAFGSGSRGGSSFGGSRGGGSFGGGSSNSSRGGSSPFGGSR